MPDPDANTEAPADTASPAKGGKKASEGNESTEKVAGGGTLAENLKSEEPKESPTPTEAELDALDNQEKLALEDAEKAKALAASTKADQAPKEPSYLSALDKFVKIVAVNHPGTPDSYVCWGVGGVKLTLGDIREVAKNYELVKTAFAAVQEKQD